MPTAVISYLQMHARRGEFHTGVFFQNAPAISQFLKLTLLTPVALLPTGVRTSFVQHITNCLGGLLCGSAKHMKAGANLSLSASGSEENRDSAGLPVHLNPLLSKPVLVTEIRLQHALWLHMQSSANLIVKCCEVQRLILVVWVQSSRLCIVPPKVLKVRLASVVGLAKQCAQLGLHLFQQVQDHSTSQAKHPGERFVAKQCHGRQQQPSETSLHLKLGVLNKACTQAIRALLFETSCFQFRDNLYNSQGAQH